MITVLLCITWFAFGFLVGVLATYLFATHEAKRRRRDAKKRKRDALTKATKAAREKMREEKEANERNII